MNDQVCRNEVFRKLGFTLTIFNFGMFLYIYATDKRRLGIIKVGYRLGYNVRE